MTSVLTPGLPPEVSRPSISVAATFDDWTSGRDVAAIGTNAGSAAIPFQTWKRFKEAFAPELVREAVERSPVPVARLFDPFGGSGTSALAAQFLGIHPVTIEVNPYLVDLIEAKLATYNSPKLSEQLATLLELANSKPSRFERDLPPTFVEPGVKERYLFSTEISDEISVINAATSALDDPVAQRFFRVALSGVLLDFCNARVNGKGRRYRSNWRDLNHSAEDLRGAFDAHSNKMISEVSRLGRRLHMGFDVRLGDSRKVDLEGVSADLAVFSPPYPNSFDYTDVYNIELWMLGYLREWADNSELRASTLASHVQVSRDFLPAPMGSAILDDTLIKMDSMRGELWDARLPEMIAGYFADLWGVIDRTTSVLTSGGQIWMVVGDSRYSNIDVFVADIIAELAPTHGLSVSEARPFRSMRASPQQGGRRELFETLLVLQKP